MVKTTNLPQPKTSHVVNDLQKMLNAPVSDLLPSLSPNVNINPNPIIPQQTIEKVNNNDNNSMNKNKWFNPHVFLQSFPVFPPPTRFQQQTKVVNNNSNCANDNSNNNNTSISNSNLIPINSKLKVTTNNIDAMSTNSSTVSSSNGISKKKKTKRNKIDIPLHDLIRYMTLPQSVAAKKLNVSLSTLKRRYYELVMEIEGSNSEISNNKVKWPSMPTNYHELSVATEDSVPSEKKGSLKYILNRYDAHDNTHVDSLSMTVLNFSFKQNKLNSESH
ncbi:hypothetical protein ABK040_011585 [Willaertia magna]